MVLESSKFSTNTSTAKSCAVWKVRTASPRTLETLKAYNDPSLNRWTSNGSNPLRLTEILTQEREGPPRLQFPECSVGERKRAESDRLGSAFRLRLD